MKYEIILKRLGQGFTEFYPEFVLKSNELIKLELEKIALMKQLQIAVAIEKSEKNYIFVLSLENNEQKILESDNTLSVYDLRHYTNLKVYSTKKSKNEL